MRDENATYRYLTGSSNIVHSRSSLWLGSDHLLSVVNEDYSESYRRFFFKDIRAIVVQKTSTGKLWSILLSLLAATFASLMLTSIVFAWSKAATIAFAVFAGIFLLCLLVNGLRGPTCTCYIQTAIQKNDLCAVRRLRHAMKLIGQLRSIIEAVQGTLTEADAARLAQEAELQADSSSISADASTPTTAIPRPRRHDHGQAHLALFVFLLLDMCQSAATFFYQGPVMESLAFPIIAGTIVFVILALIRQTHSDLPSGIKNTTWCTLGYLIVSLATGIGYGFLHAITQLRLGNEPDFSSLSPYDSPLVAWLLVFSIVGSGTLGFLGLYLLNRFRKSYGRPPPLPTTDSSPSENASIATVTTTHGDTG
jgi:hypothetical protein